MAGAAGLLQFIQSALLMQSFGACVAVLSIMSLGLALGQIAGPMVAGILADLTGNCRMGFTVLALTAGCGSLLFLFAVQPQRPPAH